LLDFFLLSSLPPASSDKVGKGKRLTDSTVSLPFPFPLSFSLFPPSSLCLGEVVSKVYMELLFPISPFPFSLLSSFPFPPQMSEIGNRKCIQRMFVPALFPPPFFSLFFSNAIPMAAAFPPFSFPFPSFRVRRDRANDSHSILSASRHFPECPPPFFFFFFLFFPWVACSARAIKAVWPKGGKDILASSYFSFSFPFIFFISFFFFSV